MKNLIILIVILTTVSLTFKAQSEEIDSLFTIARNENLSDSLKIDAYVKVSKVSLEQREFLNLKIIYNEAFSIAEKSNNNIYLGTTTNFLGLYYLASSEANFDSSEYQFSRALDYLKNEKNSRLKGLIYNNLSAINNIQGDLEKSKYYAEKEAEIGKELNDKDLQSRSLQLLSGYYQSIGDYSTMLDKNNESLKLARDSKDSARIIMSMVQVAESYGLLGELEKSIEVYEKTLKDFDLKINKLYRHIIFSELGSKYADKKQYFKALENYYKSFDNTKNQSYYSNLNKIATTYIQLINDGVPENKIPRLIKANEPNLKSKTPINELIYSYINESIEGHVQLGLEEQLIYPLTTLGEYYILNSDFKNAETTYNKAWNISKSKNLIKEQNLVSYELYTLTKNQNNTKEALKWHEIYLSTKDSLSTKDNQQEIGRKLAQFEFTNVRIADSLEQIKKDEIQQIKNAQQEKNIANEQLKKYYLFGGLAITSLLLVVLFRRFNLTKKQKLLIELQKEEMEKKQIELSKTHLAIKDSINYSKRIQRAIFPSKNYINSIFSDNFILFQPKDVVSGDFYWCTDVGNKKIIVLADCTGHGVPGAFMTIIGINILKEIILEGVTDSSIILKEINTKLKSRLGQNEQKVKDGMDLGVCIIDETTVEFSGAHFPLYHISDNEFVEYKGSNLFLGNEENIDNIKTHYIPYKKGDLIYMSTDGFPDQKGGVKGKKFFYKPLRNLIHNNSSLPMNEQHDLLKTEFKNWIAINNNTQMDDVSIIGIKL